MVRQVFAGVMLLLASAAPAAASGICFCPLCALGMEKNYQMVAASMLPGLTAGQCLRVTPQQDGLTPGDVIVFHQPAAGNDQVLRVIALSGQRIAVRDGIPVIDGVMADRLQLDPIAIPRADIVQADDCDGDICLAVPSQETLPGGASYQVLDGSLTSIGDHMAETVVPDGHVFLMGDNRDNAMDSRFSPEVLGPGMVPLTDVVGVVEPPLRPAP